MNWLVCLLHSCFYVSLRKRELVALLYLSAPCFVTVSVFCLFFTMPWVGLHCVIIFLVLQIFVYLYYFSCT